MKCIINKPIIPLARSTFFLLLNDSFVFPSNIYAYGRLGFWLGLRLGLNFGLDRLGERLGRRLARRALGKILGAWENWRGHIKNTAIMCVEVYSHCFRPHSKRHETGADGKGHTLPLPAVPACDSESHRSRWDSVCV